MRPKFRSYFQNIVDYDIRSKNEIKKFISKNVKKSTKKKTLKRHSKRRTKNVEKLNFINIFYTFNKVCSKSIKRPSTRNCNGLVACSTKKKIMMSISINFSISKSI